MIGIIIISIICVTIIILTWIGSKNLKVNTKYEKAWQDGYNEGKIDGAMQFGVPVHPNCMYKVKPHVEQ